MYICLLTRNVTFSHMTKCASSIYIQSEKIWIDIDTGNQNMCQNVIHPKHKGPCKKWKD